MESTKGTYEVKPLDINTERRPRRPGGVFLPCSFLCSYISRFNGGEGHYQDVQTESLSKVTLLNKTPVFPPILFST